MIFSSIFYALTSFCVHNKVLWQGKCGYFHFTSEETEAQSWNHLLKATLSGRTEALNSCFLSVPLKRRKSVSQLQRYWQFRSDNSSSWELSCAPATRCRWHPPIVTVKSALSPDIARSPHWGPPALNPPSPSPFLPQGLCTCGSPSGDHSTKKLHQAGSSWKPPSQRPCLDTAAEVVDTHTPGPFISGFSFFSFSFYNEKKSVYFI